MSCSLRGTSCSMKTAVWFMAACLRIKTPPCWEFRVFVHRLVFGENVQGNLTAANKPWDCIALFKPWMKKKKKWAQKSIHQLWFCHKWFLFLFFFVVLLLDQELFHHVGLIEPFSTAACFTAFKTTTILSVLLFNFFFSFIASIFNYPSFS